MKTYKYILILNYIIEATFKKLTCYSYIRLSFTISIINPQLKS